MKRILAIAMVTLGLMAQNVSAQAPPDGQRRFRPPQAKGPPPVGQPPQVRPPRPSPPVIVAPPPRRPPPQIIVRPPPPVYRAPPVYRPPPPVYRAPPPPVIFAPAPSYGPPPNWRHRRAYGWCEERARRLHQFEYQMQLDGRVSKDEVRIARSLRADLAANCGGGRWAPNRGWYY
jgi:hypothetical protein